MATIPENDHIVIKQNSAPSEPKTNKISRASFLKFIGAAGIALSVAPFVGLQNFVPKAEALLPGDKVLKKMTTFDVLKHGFSFGNKWTHDINMALGTVCVDIANVIKTCWNLGTVNFGNTSLGLCGGMTFAARDSWALNRNAFAVSKPSQGSTNYSYIYNRQQHSFKNDNSRTIRRVIEHTFRPNKNKCILRELVTGDCLLKVTGVRTLSNTAFDNTVRPQIDLNRPVTLCLVKTKDSLNLKVNHQVLAIGYTLSHSMPDRPVHNDIHIYNPSYPEEIHTLHFHYDFGVLETVQDKPTIDDRWRSFFVTQWNSSTPPWS